MVPDLKVLYFTLEFVEIIRSSSEAKVEVGATAGVEIRWQICSPIDLTLRHLRGKPVKDGSVPGSVVGRRNMTPLVPEILFKCHRFWQLLIC